MKITLLTLLCFFYISNTFSQTTVEEYNYVTKGYKVQIESGLDMKRGYELEDVDYVPQLGSGGSYVREVWLKKLKRVTTGGSKTVAYMIVYQKAGSPKEYLCIPMPNSPEEIRNAYFASLNPGLFNNSDRLALMVNVLSRSLIWD